MRHEVLVSLGDIIEDKELLKQFLGHKDQIVAESCEVAYSYIDARRAEKEFNE